MLHRFRIPLVAGLIGVGTLVIPGAAPAGAGPVVQDLQVSVASAAAGDVVSVASASCALPADVDGFRFLQVRFLSGAAPDEVLAGAGTGDGTASFVVPAWIDPDAPAVIEASCVEVAFPGGGDPVTTTTDFDPVALDVVADPGAPTQDRTFSRTTVRVGQGFTVDVTGCDLAGAQAIEVDALLGDDPSGRTLQGLGFLGYGPLEGTSGTAEVFAANDSAGVSVASSDDGPAVIEEVEETPTDLAEGTYTVIPTCLADDDTVLLYEPQVVEVQGTSPTGDVDLTVPAGSREATMAGGTCDQDEVPVQLQFESAASLVGGFDQVQATAEVALAAPEQAGAAAAARRAPRSAGARARVVERSARLAAKASGGAGGMELTAVPDADGAWSAEGAATFDEGVVFGIASCGDPFADGFAYDVQVAKVHVEAPTTTTQPTTTTTAPPPANAVSGTPSYAG